MKKHKHTTIFSSVLRPLVAEQKDEYLAMASLVNIGDFVPEIDTAKNIDLLPIAFNAAVVNRPNKNGDVIDTTCALSIADHFINKPINIEHNRERIIGTILTAGYSEFGTDNIIDKESLADFNGPFNITLGGVIWRTINEDLADIIEDSADPTSENYLKVSASWELGFTDYKLAVVEGDEKTIVNAELIGDEAENFETLKDHLASLGGSGKLDDGRYVYRQVVGDVVPLGIGLTETPAADVVGVVTKNEMPIDEEKQSDPDEEKNLKKKEPSQNREEDNASQKQTKAKTKRDTMKITNLKDINDESLQVLQASDIASFVEEELQKASENYAAEKSALEDSRKEAQDQIDALSAEAEKRNGELEKVQAELAEMQAEKAAKEAEEKFNQRMTSMDEEYELTDEDREILASDVKDMTDEDFAAYANKMAVLLSSKNKKVIEEKQAKEAEAAQTEEVTPKVEEAKVEEAKASDNEVSDVVEEVLDQAEEESDAIANSTSTEDPSVYNKYRSAFGLDQFKISV